MNNQEIKSLSEQYVIHSYGVRPIALVRGKGNLVYDADGKEYLDFIGGIAVNILGHCHPKLIDAVTTQINQLIHVSNLYYIEPQAKLAELLTSVSFADQCFFCNSGAEANEAAIKLARKYAKLNDSPDKVEVITLLGSFHGRTYAAMTATGQEKYQQGFEPLVPGFKYAVLNDLDSVKQLISSKTCAVLIEPIQGESGVHPCTPEFIQGVRDLCNQHNALLIFDEVQCGLGRTGKFFAYEHYNVTPDIMSLAKGLAGGLPMGAMVATQKAAAAFTPGNHASTFGGNPLCAAAAYTVLKTIQEEKLLENAASMGQYMFAQLQQLQSKFSMIKEIRGKGLMLGAEIDRPGAEIVNQCLQKGLLMNCAAGSTLRLLPSLLVTKSEIDRAMGILDTVLRDIQ